MLFSLSQDILAFFALVFADDSRASDKLIQTAIDKYCEVALSAALKPKRMVTLASLVSAIPMGKSVGQIVSIIKKMLEDVPSDTYSVCFVGFITLPLDVLLF